MVSIPSSLCHPQPRALYPPKSIYSHFPPHHLLPTHIQFYSVATLVRRTLPHSSLSSFSRCLLSVYHTQLLFFSKDDGWFNLIMVKGSIGWAKVTSLTIYWKQEDHDRSTGLLTQSWWYCWFPKTVPLCRTVMSMVTRIHNIWTMCLHPQHFIVSGSQLQKPKRKKILRVHCHSWSLCL